MKPLKILVVEDEVIVATDIEETLLSLDYQVQKTVATGKAAIEEVERSLPDIILMDIMLKGQMTGIEAARII
ncbi:MAG: response regulator, partial [Sphingobacteriia bacterium]|nr:response regulator [Sphingobacteriia bacterium]